MHPRRLRRRQALRDVNVEIVNLTMGHTESGTQECAEGDTGVEGLTSPVGLNVAVNAAHADAIPAQKLQTATVLAHSRAVGLHAGLPWWMT